MKWRAATFHYLDKYSDLTGYARLHCFVIKIFQKIVAKFHYLGKHSDLTGELPPVFRPTRAVI